MTSAFKVFAPSVTDGILVLFDYVHAGFRLPKGKPLSARVVSRISAQLPSNLAQRSEQGKCNCSAQRVRPTDGLAPTAPLPPYQNAFRRRKNGFKLLRRPHITAFLCSVNTLPWSDLGYLRCLGGELFKALARVDMLHVPYRGSALVTNALLSGEVMTAFTNPISSMPHVKAGRIKNLGVTSAQRWPLLPDYPTLAESGVPGYELLIWNGIVVRQGTPQAIIERLHSELVKAITAPDIVKHLAANGSRPMVQEPSEFGSFIRNEIAKWAKVIAAAGVRAH